MLDFFLTNDNSLMDFAVDSDLLEHVARLELSQIKYLTKHSIVDSAIEANNNAVLAMDSYCLSSKQVANMLKKAEDKINKMQATQGFDSMAIKVFLESFRYAVQKNSGLKVEAD